MSKDTPNKQKNIDDVLLSIDSLMDTASDIQLGDPVAIPAQPTSKSLAGGDKQTVPVKTKKPQNRKPNPKSELSEKPVQNKSHNETKTASTNKQPVKPGKPATVQNKMQNETIKQTKNAHEAASQDQTSSVKKPAKIKQVEADKANIAIEDQPTAHAQNPSKKEPVRNINIDNDPSGSLNFTTVDDDLSQAMRELPVLEDIVTAEDLALIGSGKEPPKKILTEAFKRLSLTDKLIEILENQLSDYNISKLEYKYLHELFDELIDKGNDKN